MLRRLVFGLGAAGLFGAAAVAQFAVDRVNTPVAPKAAAPVAPPAAPPAAPPVLPPTVPKAAPPVGGYVPPVGGFSPPPAVPTGFTPAPLPTPAAGFDPAPRFAPMPTPAAAPAEPLNIPTALPADHPWLLRPEHGAFVILLRSYSRPARPSAADPGLTARELAEGLADEVRRLPQAKGLGVYLYELVSEERKAEAQAAADARRKAAEFAARMSDFRQKAELNGMTFLDPEQALRYKSFNYRDQIGVVVGGFRTEDEAVRALAKVKHWPTPANTKLLDGGAIAKQGADGKATIEKTYLNPYGQAMVVANPTVPRAAPVPGTVAPPDPFIARLNEGRPYSLLRATKTWTLGVKAFNAPVRVQTRDDDNVSIRLFGTPKGGDALAAGAEAAEQMAKGLREMRDKDGTPVGVEAFVLHHRNGSMVTVGQFDGPTDPALHEMRRRMMSMRFMPGDPRVTENASHYLHEGIVPIPIPR
ncbi:MAG TPA: hypothetical protein VD866_21200 [Urbifossiella sp.]|nr:hypothetical protein [Urbifossiella sp.]